MASKDEVESSMSSEYEQVKGGEPVSQQQDTLCWICLDDCNPDKLVVPCKCQQRPVHHACLNRWRIQAAGTREETSCRFCNEVLPDWRESMAIPSTSELVWPVMAVVFEGQVHRLRVQPGADGLKLFKQQVQAMLGVDIGEDFDVEIQVKMPDAWAKTGVDQVTMNGLSAFTNATEIAALHATERHMARAAASPPSIDTAAGASAVGALVAAAADIPGPSRSPSSPQAVITCERNSTGKVATSTANIVGGGIAGRSSCGNSWVWDDKGISQGVARAAAAPSSPTRSLP